ncbi:MAG: phosphatidylinositol-specific phospholipase C domain-containing protein [Crocinitomicaceae bacterium]|nr:phosphatidylinositol-specific phospholipase C domain-containing protein [Crocinitomicaceae bacterium]
MRATLLLISTFTLLSWNTLSQCNGDVSTCDRRFDEVAYLTTHNAFNAQDQGYTFPNQSYGLTQQLNEGVRGLMLDVYDFLGTTLVYHGSSILGSDTFNSTLYEIRQFLENNPNEIITIILECYVSANTIESELNSAGLNSYLYTKPTTGEWATLQEMINANERLVIFTDQDDASPSQGWYHYAWDLMVETHYTVNDINDFNNTYNRGDAWNDLFIFNHFVTDATLGIGIEASAAIVNEYTFLSDRIIQHYTEQGKFPNFITLDFYHLGDGKAVVDSLNSGTYFVGNPELEPTTFTISPNPTDTYFTLEGLNAGSTSISIVNALGKTVLFKGNFTSYEKIETSTISPGMYSVIIHQKGSAPVVKKLIVN